MLAACSGLSRRRRPANNRLDKVLGLGRVVVWVPVATEVDRTIGFHQLIEPLQSPSIGLPHGKPCAFI